MTIMMDEGVLFSLFVLAVMAAMSIIWTIANIRRKLKAKKIKKNQNNKYEDYIRSHVFIFHTKFSMVGTELYYTTKYCYRHRVIALCDSGEFIFSPSQDITNIRIDDIATNITTDEKKNRSVIEVDIMIVPSSFNVFDNLSTIIDEIKFKGIIICGFNNTYNDDHGFNILVSSECISKVTKKYISTEYACDYYAIASMLSNSIDSSCDIGGIIVNMVHAYSISAPYTSPSMIPADCTLKDILRIAVNMDMDNPKKFRDYNY